MSKYRLVSLLIFCSLTVFGQTPTWVNGQASRALIGQSSFANLSTSGQSVLGNASGLAFVNGTLWVADATTMCGLVPNNPIPPPSALAGEGGCYVQNNRVLAFPTANIPALNADLTDLGSQYCNLCGYPASLVLGQVNFTTFQPGTSQTASSSTGSMNTPTAVASDGTRFAVADTGNNRVLLWNSIPSSTNAPPDIVLGQSSFTGNLANESGSSTQSPPPTQSSMRAPSGVWINPDGHVFVADTQNMRILIWNHFPTSNNQPADVVLGATDFVTGSNAACNTVNASGSFPTVTASIMCDPASVTSDGTRVYVADYGFNRVLIWNSIPTSNGQPADVVLGQPNMTSTIPNNTNGTFCPDGYGPISQLSVTYNQTTGLPLTITAGGQCNTNMTFPRFALADPTSNQLFVADGGNGRVMVFSPIPTTNGATATAVLGQPNFETDVNSSASASVASTQIDNTSAVDLVPVPTALAYDPVQQNLYVADPTNNRVLVYTPGQNPLVANSVVNWASQIIRQEGVISIEPYLVGGSPVSGDTITVTIQSTTYGPYKITSTDTFDTIAQALVNLINSSNSGAGDPNVIATFAGTDTGSLYLSSKAVDLSYDSISFSATPSNTTNETIVTSGSYLSSGTGATGAPGMLVQITGTNLSDASPSNPAVAALSGVIPTTLGGAQVYFNGVAAPVFQADSNTIVSQLPFTVALNGANSASVYVRTVHNDGSVTVTNATPFYIAPANPGIFNAPIVPNQARPWPAMNAYHQPGNPTAVVSVDGTINAGDQATITIAGKAYQYTVQSTDTTYSVATALVNKINGAPDPNVTASLGGEFSRVVLTAKKSGAAGVGISVTASANSSADIVMTAYTGSTCCNVTPGSLISPSNPAGPGELITISAAGLGFLTNPANSTAIIPASGQPYNGPQPNVVQSDATVSGTMGGATAEVINAGMAAGSYGVYQVQLIVPSNLSTNAVTQLNIAQNAFVSNTVTVAVGTPGQVIPVPPPVVTSPIQIQIDTPNGQNVSGSIPVGGWAIDTQNSISTVAMSVDGALIGNATYGGTRSDVCSIYTNALNCPGVGFNTVLDTTQFPDGSHTLAITATDSAGTQLTVSSTFTTSNYGGANPTTISIDTPGTTGGPFQGSAMFAGWAVNTNSPIASNGVTVSIDGQAQSTPATYGLYRPDVCAVYPSSPSCPNVGWSYLVDTTTLSNGTHTFAVKAAAENGQYTVQAHTFTVANWTTANPITMSIDFPGGTSGAISGTAVFGGWAVDLDSVISSVLVSIDGVQYGSGGYGTTRNDVCSIYTGAQGCPNVGWNIGIDTTLLGDGPHTLAVTAVPFSGNGLTVTRQFTVSNDGAANTAISIDVPGTGSPALSGITNIGGWAVNTVAPVSTVQVTVDGVVKGYAAYGGTRSDACAILGNLPGCPAIGWNYLLDTTMLTNGSHMLEITATSTNGQRASKSTSFTVSNGASTGPTSVSITQPNSTSNPFLGIAKFSGTATSTSSQITSVSITVDGAPYGTAAPVQGTFADGWTFLLNTNQLPDGGHTLGATAFAADGSFAVASAGFQVTNWSSPNPMIISIDVPNTTTNVLSGVYAIGGWAVDQNAAVNSVSVSVDGIPFGYAQYGGTRTDVCSVYPTAPSCPGVGWNAGLDTTALPNGTHTLAITATTVNGQSSTTTATFVSAN